MPNDILDEDTIRLTDVYVERWDLLHRALRKRIGSRDLADEAMQETWFRLRKSIQGRGPIRDPQSYILMVAANISIDLLRREKRHTLGHDSDRAIVEAIEADRPSMDDILIAKDEVKRLVRVLLELPPKARNVLILNRCAQMSHRDIAAKLGISERMVVKYMSQALRHCRDAFRAQRS